jgi:polar amino acid transport system permease protein
MSEPTPEVDPDAETEAGTAPVVDGAGWSTRLFERYSSVRRRIAVVAGVAFWGYFLLRWLNDWVLAPSVGVPRGQPIVAPATFGGSDAWLNVAAGLLPTVAPGVWLTVWLTVVSIALGFVVAVPLSVVRVYGGYSRYVALGFTELIRGTPLLAQLFVLYYGLGLTSWIRELPLVGQGIVPEQAVWVAIIGFTINSAAYQSEYIRSALVSVGTGQLTAARAIGLSKVGGIRYVVLPQALRYAIPGWSNELVYLIKYSSLATFVTVPELFNRAESVASSNFKFTAVFTAVAVIYLGIVLTASKLVTRVEDRVAIPGVGGRGGRERTS